MSWWTTLPSLYTTNPLHPHFTTLTYADDVAVYKLAKPSNSSNRTSKNYTNLEEKWDLEFVVEKSTLLTFSGSQPIINHRKIPRSYVS